MKIGSGAFSSLRGIAAVVAMTGMLAVTANAVLVPGNKKDATPPPVPIRFQDLPNMAPDEMILVDYNSEGCAGAVHYLYRFDGGAQPSFDVWIQGIYQDTDPLHFGYLGDSDLSPDQIRGLDNLLDFYRTKKSRGCCFFDTILVQHYKAGRLLQQERFRDLSDILHNIETMTPEEMKKYHIPDPHATTLLSLLHDTQKGWLIKPAEPSADQPEPETTNTPPTPHPENK